MPTKKSRTRLSRGKIALEFRDVSDGRCRNILQSFAREECLVTSDDYVQEREESAEHIITDDQAGTILEKCTACWVWRKAVAASYLGFFSEKPRYVVN